MERKSVNAKGRWGDTDSKATIFTIFTEEAEGK